MEDKRTAGQEEFRDMDFPSTRGLRYCELFAVGPEWITVYNSIGLSEAPQEQWDALDAEAAAKQLGVQKVVKNGPHWWMADKATINFGVEETTVGGIGFRKVARLPAFIAQSGGVEPPRYKVLEANKSGVNVYLAGRPVYELVAPDGRAFVLQSTNVPPEELDVLEDRLAPTEGWQFRIRILDEDWNIAMQGKVKVASDDLKNIYNLPPEADASEEGSAEEAKSLDVLVAIYPGPVSATEDYDAFVAVVMAGTVETEGIVLVSRDAEGEMQTQEEGIGRIGRKKVVPGIVDAMNEKLPPGAAGIIAIYKHAQAAEVDQVLANSFTKSVAGMNHARPNELKDALAKAQAGL